MCLTIMLLSKRWCGDELLYICIRNLYVDAVVSRLEKTVLGFLIVKLLISGDDGVIRPVWHGGYTPHSLSMEESVSE